MAGAPPIVQLEDIVETHNVLIYGESGCGKTTWAASHGGLILAGEQGLTAAKRYYPHTHGWKLHDWNDFEDAVTWLKNGGWKKYKWVGLDSITHVQEMCKDHILKRESERDPNHSQYFIEWQENLELQQAICKRVRDLVALPTNMVFTALPCTFDFGGDETVMPYVEGKKGAISQYICGQMSATGHMTQRNAKVAGKVKSYRRIHWRKQKTSEGGYIFAKNRYELPTYTDETSLPELAKLMDAASNHVPPARRATTRRRAASNT